MKPNNLRKRIKEVIDDMNETIDSLYGGAELKSMREDSADRAAANIIVGYRNKLEDILK